jgi:hypothetical protein
MYVGTYSCKVYCQLIPNYYVTIELIALNIMNEVSLYEVYLVPSSSTVIQ